MEVKQNQQVTLWNNQQGHVLSVVGNKADVMLDSGKRQFVDFGHIVAAVDTFTEKQARFLAAKDRLASFKNQARLIARDIKTGKLPQGYEIQESDVGTSFGDSSFGNVQQSNVGKKAYVKEYGLVMENDAQRDARKKKSNMLPFKKPTEQPNPYVTKPVNTEVIKKAEAAFKVLSPGKVDEGKWEKAIDAVKDSSGKAKSDFSDKEWATVNTVYQNMGGKFKSKKSSITKKAEDLVEGLVPAYIQTALWSSTISTDDPDDEDYDKPFDSKYSESDIAPESMAKAEKDCAAFMAKAEKLRAELNPDFEFDDADVGHNFWLNRNGHGAGFWDGDYPEALGDALSDLSKEFGECDLYVGDDGKLYFSGGKDVEASKKTAVAAGFTEVSIYLDDDRVSTGDKDYVKMTDDVDGVVSDLKEKYPDKEVVVTPAGAQSVMIEVLSKSASKVVAFVGAPESYDELDSWLNSRTAYYIKELLRAYNKTGLPGVVDLLLKEPEMHTWDAEELQQYLKEKEFSVWARYNLEDGVFASKTAAHANDFEVKYPVGTMLVPVETQQSPESGMTIVKGVDLEKKVYILEKRPLGDLDLDKVEPAQVAGARYEEAISKVDGDKSLVRYSALVIDAGCPKELLAVSKVGNNIKLSFKDVDAIYTADGQFVSATVKTAQDTYFKGSDVQQGWAEAIKQELDAQGIKYQFNPNNGVFTVPNVAVGTADKKVSEVLPALFGEDYFTLRKSGYLVKSDANKVLIYPWDFEINAHWDNIWNRSDYAKGAAKTAAPLGTLDNNTIPVDRAPVKGLANAPNSPAVDGNIRTLEEGHPAESDKKGNAAGDSVVELAKMGSLSPAYAAEFGELVKNAGFEGLVAMVAQKRLAKKLSVIARLRPENSAMQDFLRQNGVDARVKYISSGSMRGTWRLQNPVMSWTPELQAKLTGLGFVDFNGEPLGPNSGNGGRFSVFVRGHDELLHQPDDADAGESALAEQDLADELGAWAAKTAATPDVQQQLEIAHEDGDVVKLRLVGQDVAFTGVPERDPDAPGMYVLYRDNESKVNGEAPTSPLFSLDSVDRIYDRYVDPTSGAETVAARLARKLAYTELTQGVTVEGEKVEDPIKAARQRLAKKAARLGNYDFDIHGGRNWKLEASEDGQKIKRVAE